MFTGPPSFEDKKEVGVKTPCLSVVLPSESSICQATSQSFMELITGKLNWILPKIFQSTPFFLY